MKGKERSERGKRKEVRKGGMGYRKLCARGRERGGRVKKGK